jgi:hypothetical protein
MEMNGKAPQHIAMHPLLQPPKEVLAQILPQKSLSVLDFLSFKLPAIMVTTKHVTIEAFFSKDQPSLGNTQLIQDLPIPSTHILGMLSKSSSEAIENGAFSSKCAHLTGDASKTQLLLWVLTYWCEVVMLHHKHLKPWIRAEQNLERRTQLWKNEGGKEARTLVTKIYNALTYISWSGTLDGFVVAESVVELAVCATDDWLSDVHENQMLDLLRRRIQHQPQSQKIDVMIKHTLDSYHHISLYVYALPFPWSNMPHTA